MKPDTCTLCSHQMRPTGATKVYWCPHCGCLQYPNGLGGTELGIPASIVHASKLIDRVDEMVDAETGCDPHALSEAQTPLRRIVKNPRIKLPEIQPND